MKLKRTIFAILLISQLFCTGCWCSRNRCCSPYTKARGNSAMPAGCNECSGYSPDMFGAPVTGNAMMQSPGQPIDERLGTPAKQSAYEGPTKK